jgi:hypothetical protein
VGGGAAIPHIEIFQQASSFKDGLPNFPESERTGSLRGRERNRDGVTPHALGSSERNGPSEACPALGDLVSKPLGGNQEGRD